MSRPTLEDIIGADMAPFVVCTDWSFADGDTPVAREWKRRAEVNDRVWRVLNGLRDRAVGDRRALHKNQQYARGYGASLRSLHEMAKAWPEHGPMIEAQRYAHAYGGGTQQMSRMLRGGGPVAVPNYIIQSRHAEQEMVSLHEKMIADGWEWDGMDGYTAPSRVERVLRGEED